MRMLDDQRNNEQAEKVSESVRSTVKQIAYEHGMSYQEAQTYYQRMLHQV